MYVFYYNNYTKCLSRVDTVSNLCYFLIARKLANTLKLHIADDGFGGCFMQPEEKVASFVEIQRSSLATILNPDGILERPNVIWHRRSHTHR